MYNVPIHQLDAVARPVVAIGTEYPDGHVLPMHSHRRSQLLYGATGAMQVVAGGGRWLVPPQQAVWIPAGIAHQVTLHGVSTRSLYIESAALNLGAECRVIAISPLVRQLVLAAVDLPLEYALQGRDTALIDLLLHELQRASTLPLHIPLPAPGNLLDLCQAFIAAPDIHWPLPASASGLHMSVRTFSRQFREHTGMSFSEWKQRACVVLALARLAERQPVTQVALALGYDSPAAFSAMFRRVLGQAPRDFLQGEAAVR